MTCKIRTRVILEAIIDVADVESEEEALRIAAGETLAHGVATYAEAEVLEKHLKRDEYRYD